jgi:hypothetical protein
MCTLISYNCQNGGQNEWNVFIWGLFCRYCNINVCPLCNCFHPFVGMIGYHPNVPIVRQTHPWVVPLGMSNLNFFGPIELLKCIGNI